MEALRKRLERLKSERGESIQSTDSGELVPDLLNRIDEIEEELFRIEDKIGQQSIVHAFDSLNITLGGFLTRVVCGFDFGS